MGAVLQVLKLCEGVTMQARQQLVGIFLICSIVSAGVSAQSRQPSASSANKEIAGIKDKLADAVHSKRLDDLALLFAPDATFLVSTTGRVTGRAAIRSMFEKVMGSYTSSIIMTSVRIEKSGDIAYDSGDFEETITAMADGQKRDIKGSYLLIFKRQRGGSWLIVEQVMTARVQPKR
jgi:uncharacterized protein (TIGR02246 family)